MGASLDNVLYATREDVQRALDTKTTARNAAQIDRQLETASRDVELLCHRIFYPVLDTRYFDWPPRAGATPWILRLDAAELISVTSLITGGTTLSPDEYNLEPNVSGPPYSRVEINLGSDGAFGGGPTYQRNIQITGLWGYRNTEQTAGTLAASTDGSTTTITVDGPASAALGVGSVIRVGSERMLVTGRTMASTGQTLSADIDQQVKTTLLTVPDSSTYTVDEVILCDGERMLIVDIAGPNLVVRRAWDGTANAAHTAGTPIYALRALTVTRGALGTTAAAHTNGSPIARWMPPGPVRTLVIALAVSGLSSETSGYTKAVRAAEGSGERNRDTSALATLRQNVYDDLGRKARMRSV